MLDNINSIEDLKALSIEQLPALCEEIRQYLINTINVTGGHLASNLGVVELTVALHYIFDHCDKIVWDVGHQSYIHKILTGRKDSLKTIRTECGLSGFCDPAESDSDVTITGHASTAISSALGIATARDIAGQDYNVVSVIGDGALTGGLSYEGLNNVKDTKLLIILNDNNMSIGTNVGGISKAISRIRVGNYYNRKKKIKSVVCKVPLIGKAIYKVWKRIKTWLKMNFVHTTYFDNYGLKYIGIVDGNDVKDLIYCISRIKKNINEPTLLHIITQKGRGYQPAIEQPIEYHNLVVDNSHERISSDVVGEQLVNLAYADTKIVAITAAMKDGVGLNKFAQQYPDRFFDVGIAEGHAVTFASGMATAGHRPYVLIYSTFLQRAYDNIIHDVAIANLPVTFLIDRAGLVGKDGKTHQGLYDLTYLCSIPNMTVWTPFCYRQLQDMIQQSATFNAPLAIRYGKSMLQLDVPFDNSWVTIGDTANIKLLAVGANMVHNSLMAQQQLALSNINVQVVAVTSVKPLDMSFLGNIGKEDVLITLEENVYNGGFGSQIAVKLTNQCKIFNMAVNDVHVPHATVQQQIDNVKLSTKDIVKLVESVYK